MEVCVSCDDGHRLDYKVIDCLNKYELVGMFYIPIKSFGFEDIEMYKGHKVGGHTINHDNDISRKAIEYQREEISGCKKMLEDKIGNSVDSFCYPRGRYLPSTIQCVKEAGFKEARTTKVLATSYDDPFTKPTTIHVYPHRKEYDGRNWIVIAEEILEKKPEYFHIWMHSKEIEKWKQWNNLERIFKLLAQMKNEDCDS